MGFRVTVRSGTGQRVEVIRNGKVVENAVPSPLASNDVTLDFDLDVARGDWVRINVRDGAGTTVIANPIYFR